MGTKDLGTHHVLRGPQTQKVTRVPDSDIDDICRAVVIVCLLSDPGGAVGARAQVERHREDQEVHCEDEELDVEPVHTKHDSGNGLVKTPKQNTTFKAYYE